MVLLFQLLPAVPDDVAAARDGVGGRPGGDDVLAGQFDLRARLHADEVADLPAAVEPLHDQEQLLHIIDGLGRDDDERRFHLHHPPPGDVGRQGADVVEVGVRDEPVGHAHEVPRVRTNVEPDLEFGHPPARLHGGAAVPLDRQAVVGCGTGTACSRRDVLAWGWWSCRSGCARRLKVCGFVGWARPTVGLSLLRPYHISVIAEGGRAHPVPGFSVSASRCEVGVLAVLSGLRPDVIKAPVTNTHTTPNHDHGPPPSEEADRLLVVSGRLRGVERRTVTTRARAFEDAIRRPFTTYCPRHAETKEYRLAGQPVLHYSVMVSQYW